MTRAGEPWPAASALASAQLGVVARWQLLQLGWTSRRVSWELRQQILHRVFNGVYLFGHRAPPPGARELAALLVTRASALSHVTAGRWYGWPLDPPPAVELISPRAHDVQRREITLHRTVGLAPTDIRLRRGVPVTTPLRTLFDLAALGHPQLEAAVASAHAQRLTTPAQMTREIAAHPGSPGIDRLRELAGAERNGIIRSEVERALRRLCRRARLPEPRTNLRRAGYEVDFCWPPARLVVEVDSYGFHGHRAQFESDRRKQGDLVAAGDVVLRFTARQILDDELWVLGVLARSLGGAQ